MSGFNFGQIGNIISDFMDTDYIDIKRDVGTVLQEIYSNVSCHISYNSIDNPDPKSVDVKPIIQSITIHVPNWVDIKNNDFLVAKKMDSDGNMLIAYSGRCGNPVVSQGRKKVNMIMSGTESEDPTPVPPKNPAKIIVKYLSDELPIKPSETEEVEIGSSFKISAPVVEGYTFIKSVLDGAESGSELVFIPVVKDVGHTIIFAYKQAEQPNKARFLVNGLYTQDDGGLANGYHLYKKFNLDDVTKVDNSFRITCDDINWTHEDNGSQLSITVGVKMVLIPNNVFVQVTEIVSRVNGKVTFIAKEFEPTEDERNAYITRWYD